MPDPMPIAFATTAPLPPVSHAKPPATPPEPSSNTFNVDSFEAWPGKDQALHDPECMRLLRNAMLRKREAAKFSPVSFFEFVLREETTKNPIVVAPHQRVGIDFMLAHARSVNFWPVGYSKTFSLAGLTLYLLGQDPTGRGAIVSATQAQASKPLAMVRAYCETSNELHMVYPHMRRSTRPGDPWTQTAITIERPPGIRDASLVAAGINGEGMPGSRLSWIVVDDVLTYENTGTKEQRDRIHGLFDSQILSRLDPRGARIVVVNTAWHMDDLLHRLEAQGWPTMRMGVSGMIEVKTPPQLDVFGRVQEDCWGLDGEISTHIRPATANPADIRVRLTAHDPDPQNTKTLWPGRFDDAAVALARKNHLPSRFNQLFENQCREDETSRCKIEWIEKCKEAARIIGHGASHPFALGLVSTYDGELATYTGVDLAIEPGEEHDDCALFTFAVLPSKHRLILDVQIGQWDGPTMISKIIDVHRRFKSIIRVESNAAQSYIRQFTLNEDVSVPVRKHNTNRNKMSIHHGVETMLVELSNGAWLLPNDPYGNVQKPVQHFIDACLYYSPSKHTPDVLMAAWFAREQAREFGELQSGGADVQTSNFAGLVMSR